MERKSNYIDWSIKLEKLLNDNGINYSDYDEFYIRMAVEITEKMIIKYEVDTIISEKLIDEYTNNAIATDPINTEYYKTVSCYVKKRLSK